MFKWYVIQVRSGYELKAISSVKVKLQKANLSSNFEEYMIPKETAYKVVDGQKKIFKRNLYPGYLMVKINKTNEVYQIIRDSKYVIDLMKSPISENELDFVKENIESGKKLKDSFSSYEVLDNIKIISGPFENFFGCIDTIDNDTNKVKVTVNIFGRDTPVTLSFAQIEKVV